MLRSRHGPKRPSVSVASACWPRRPDGRRVLPRYAAEADEWLSGLADRAAGDAHRHLALLAVGGYGRGSCAPTATSTWCSSTTATATSTVADAIWYPVWDEGVHLDHSVRRPAEVLTAAAEDLRVALGLLDARMVWGESAGRRPALDRGRLLWRSKLGTKWLPLLAGRQMAERPDPRVTSRSCSSPT